MKKGPAYTAYFLLKVVFVIAPIIAGMDKFFDYLVNWDQYLHPMLRSYGHVFMKLIGVVEILVGIGVFVRPKIFANIVAVWLALIVVNLVIVENYYDIALKDLGLCLSAFALGRLAKVYGR